jgi:hypothetical protein
VDFRISWLQAGHFTDNLCRDIAKCMPCLRVLRFRPRGPPIRPPKGIVTLRGIRHLTKGCQDLSNLAIQVKAAAGERWAREAIEIPAGTGALGPISLNLMSSYITSATAVATCLRRWFGLFNVVRIDVVSNGKERKKLRDSLVRQLLPDNTVGL